MSITSLGTTDHPKPTTKMSLEAAEDEAKYRYPEHCIDMHCKLEQIEKTLNILFQRLSPCLVDPEPVGVSASNTDVKELPEKTQLLNKLREVEDHIDRVDGLASELLNRLYI